MKFRVLSDIHNDFVRRDKELFNFSVDQDISIDFRVEPLDSDSDTTLILAGDIGILSKEHTLESFLQSVSRQFKHIFYIGGNHEWYHGNITKHTIEYRIIGWDNIHTGVLELPDEKIAVVGNTLWTDFNDGDTEVMEECRYGMNDFRLIIKDLNYSAFTPKDAMILHYSQKKKIFDDVDKYNKMGWKVIVVTHHHPSPKGILPQYEGNLLNGAFFSDIESEIEKRNIEYWMCGHTHTAMQYDVGNTKVICNPKGYPGEKSNYDPKLIIETH